MSRWRELGRHIRALEDIGSIMSAMRSLAFIEARRLTESVARQQETVGAMRVAIDNLVAHYPQARPRVVPQDDVLILVGSERGMCGDFDERVALSLQANDPAARIAVGSRLCLLLSEQGAAHASIPGAAVIEDVAGVMSQIAAAVRNLTQQQRDLSTGLVAIHHTDDGGVSRTRILPVPVTPPGQCWRGKPILQLDPPQLHGMLVEHYVLASLNAILLASLLAENRRRLDQMSTALDRLHERIDNLDRKRRRARQEAITEEIEIILLGQM